MITKILGFLFFPAKNIKALEGDSYESGSE